MYREISDKATVVPRITSQKVTKIIPVASRNAKGAHRVGYCDGKMKEWKLR